MDDQEQAEDNPTTVAVGDGVDVENEHDGPYSPSSSAFAAPQDDDSFNQDVGPALYDDILNDIATADQDLAAANPDDRPSADDRCRLSGRDKCNLLVGLVLICIVVVGVLVPVALIKREEAEIEDSKNVTTAAPTVSPMPTTSPTSLRVLERDAIMTRIGEATGTSQETLDDITTPQGMALEWLLYDDPAQLTAEESPNLIQKYAVMTLFYGSDGQSSDMLDWNENGVADECQWFGIECHATSEATGSTVTASPTFATIKSIQINGTILIGSLVSEIGLLTQLNTLRLSQNQYSGELPEELFDLRQLTRLNLEENKFSSTISEKIGQLANLEVLSMYDNSFDGDLPASMANLVNLSELYLQLNFLSGSPFDHLVQMPLLEIADVANNRFSGSIPASVASLGQLKTLLLTSNLFSGNIPAALGSLLPSLQQLALSGNRFEGLIPSTLGQLSSLTYLDMGRCGLSGPIPSELGQLSQLTHLNLAQQTLTGFIPRELGSLTSIEKLILTQNNLRGNIPSELGMCENLQVLDLMINNIGGSVPLEICALRPDPLGSLSTDCRSQVTCPADCCTACGR